MSYQSSQVFENGVVQGVVWECEKKANCIAHNVGYSCRTKPPTYNI